MFWGGPVFSVGCCWQCGVPVCLRRYAGFTAFRGPTGGWDWPFRRCWSLALQSDAAGAECQAANCHGMANPGAGKARAIRPVAPRRNFRSLLIFNTCCSFGSKTRLAPACGYGWSEAQCRSAGWICAGRFIRRTGRLPPDSMICCLKRLHRFCPGRHQASFILRRFFESSHEHR